MNFEHFYDAECAFKSIEDIAGKHVTVMGLGLNGGGIASALFFARHGAFVTITDMKTADPAVFEHAKRFWIRAKETNI